MKSAAVAAIAVVTAAAGAGLVYLLTPKAGAGQAAPLGMVAEHRYTISLTYAQALPASVLAGMTVSYVQAALDAWPVLPTQAFRVVGVSSTTPTQAQFLVDCLKAPPATVTDAQLAAFTQAASVTVVDMGLTPGGGSPPASSSTWTRATSINPGDTVLVAVDATSFNTIAGVWTPPLAPTLAGFQALLASPSIVAWTHATAGTITTWGPGSAADPNDPWPSDDPSPATEYHARFVYTGTAPLSAGSFIIPALVWTRHPPVQITHQNIP